MASIHQRTYGLRPETQIRPRMVSWPNSPRGWKGARLGIEAIVHRDVRYYICFWPPLLCRSGLLRAAVYLMAARKHLSSSRFRSVAASIIAEGVYLASLIFVLRYTRVQADHTIHGPGSAGRQLV